MLVTNKVYLTRESSHMIHGYHFVIIQHQKIEFKKIQSETIVNDFHSKEGMNGNNMNTALHYPGLGFTSVDAESKY